MSGISIIILSVEISAKRVVSVERVNYISSLRCCPHFIIHTIYTAVAQWRASVADVGPPLCPRRAIPCTARPTQEEK